MGSNKVTRASSNERIVQDGELLNEAKLLSFSDDSWRTADFASSWMESLTPVVSHNAVSEDHFESADTRTWTTLAGKLTAAGMDNSTDTRWSPAEVRSNVESILALMVTDAMSRIGLDENGLLKMRSPPVYQQATLGPERHQDSYFEWNRPLWLRGSSKKTASVPTDHSYELQYTVKVSGFGLLVADTAHYLALLVLSIYIVLLIMYTRWTINIEVPPNEWDYVSEISTLTQQYVCERTLT